MAQLLEQSASIAVATGTPGLWRATLITPGQGSSGNWLDETIRRDGPIALKKGAKSFITHNRLENGEPDPLSMWGYLASDPWYEEGVGLVGDVQVLPSWIDRVAEIAPHTALSVFLMGESDEHGNITAILEDVQNGVDLVVYPGRPGSALVAKLYESAVAGSHKTPKAPEVEEDEPKGFSEMEIKDVADRVDALDAKIDSLISGRTAEVQAEADEAAVAEEVAKQVEEKVAAIADSISAVQAAEADMLPSAAKSLMESARKGEDVADRIVEAKAIRAEAINILKVDETKINPETGRLGENATGHVLRGFGDAKEAK